MGIQNLQQSFVPVPWALEALTIARGRFHRRSHYRFPRNGKSQRGFLPGGQRTQEQEMRLTTTLASAAVGAAMLAGSAVSASAAIACSGNICWHTHEAYAYPP